MRICLIAGARPNFIKAAPLHRAFSEAPGMEVRLVHTGQHWGSDMSAVFFEELGLPTPDLAIKSGRVSSTRQTARILLGLEPYFLKTKPDWVVVIGDITTALAGALCAKQLGLRVAHVEAGLRSHDREMPEELNRIAVDQLADLLFATEEAAVTNLIREGIAPERVHFTGNVLVDALGLVLPAVIARKTSAGLISASSFVAPPVFSLFTFHRPSNVDSLDGLERVIQLAHGTGLHLPVVFPMHPRIRQNLKRFGLWKKLQALANISILPPLSYSDMVFLMCQAKLVVTDSGGVQEETTCLGTPCLTFRNTTERPVTISMGTNTLIADRDPNAVFKQIGLILAGQYKKGRIPPLWDGHAASRIAAVIAGT